MTSPHLSIIIPVFNQWPLTEQCLRSMREHTPGRFFEVLVVDNASTDETATHCKALGNSLFPERFKYLPLPENLGFGRACNLGADQAEGEFLFFLNNDTILTPNWLSPLLQAFRDNSHLGVVGPLLLYPESERIQHLGLTFLPDFQIKHLYEYFPANHPVVKKSRNLQAMTGAALLLPHPVFKRCGGFYPGYRNGCEDVDICTVLRKNGYTLECITSSSIYHIVCQTDNRFSHESENHNILVKRCSSHIKADIHKMVVNDGFDLRLTPWLSLFVAMPEQRKREVEATYRGIQEPGELWLALQEEPLWIDGYEKLAKIFEMAGYWPEAYPIRFLQAHFKPSLVTFQKILRTAQKADKIDIANQTNHLIKKTTHQLNNFEYLCTKATAIIEQAKHDGDEPLVSLYKNWLNKNTLPNRRSSQWPKTERSG